MDYLEILTEYGIRFQNREDRATIKCPWHQDNEPSAVIFLERGNFHCSACTKSASFYQFIAKSAHKTIGEVYHELNKDRVDAEKTIDPQDIERFHQRLYAEQNKGLLNDLYDRGISDKYIKEYRLGVLGDRITIPISNKAGLYVNIRAHKPRAKRSKVISKQKHGKPPRLFPIDQLGYDTILLTGGELKAIAAAEELNKYGIGAITGTHGEGTWPNELLDTFQWYIVYVCMDIDSAGRTASEKLCQLLNGRCWVGFLGLDRKK